VNEHLLREQLQNEVRRCAEAVTRAREAEADRDRLADALEAERQQVAVEVGEAERLERLLEAEMQLREGLEAQLHAETRLRTGLTITAESLAAKLNAVNAENDRLGAIVGSCPRCSQRVEITPESLGAPSYAALAASLEEESESVRQLVLILGEIYAALPPHVLEANTTSGEIVGWEELPGLVRALVALRNEPAMGILPDDPTGTFKHDPEMTGRMMGILDELTREGQALDLDSPDGPRQEAEGSRQGADSPPVPDVEVPPESSPDEDRSGGAWADYMRDAHICPDCGGNGCDACGGAGELPQFNERLAAALARPRQFRWAPSDNNSEAYYHLREASWQGPDGRHLVLLDLAERILVDAEAGKEHLKALVEAAAELVDARCEGESAREGEAWIALQDALVASGLIPTEEPT
jgi:hypothetical protein